MAMPRGPSRPLNPTPVSQGQLDRAAFAEWFAGHESPIPVDRARSGPRDVLWTQEQRQDWAGVRFGLEREPGVRHLRIGFTEPIAIGTVLARSGGQLSVLKPDAAYPGDLGDDSQWLSAERLDSRAIGPSDDFEVWNLPPGTKTRAMRFTHVAEAADTESGGLARGCLDTGRARDERCAASDRGGECPGGAVGDGERRIEQRPLGSVGQRRTRGRVADLARASRVHYALVAAQREAQWRLLDLGRVLCRRDIGPRGPRRADAQDGAGECLAARCGSDHGSIPFIRWGYRHTGSTSAARSKPGPCD